MVLWKFKTLKTKEQMKGLHSHVFEMVQSLRYLIIIKPVIRDLVK